MQKEVLHQSQHAAVVDPANHALASCLQTISLASWTDYILRCIDPPHSKITTVYGRILMSL